MAGWGKTDEMTAVTRDTARTPRWLAILLVSLAGLLLEVGYTRIISYKLLYYYTYLVIGLALLGIGSGGVFVAICRPLRHWATDRIIAVAAIAGAVSIAVGYLVVAWTHVNTVAIWDYGSAESFENLLRLLWICFALFATFISFGVIVSVLLGRAGDGVGRMYFSDLLGAGIGCLLAIPLITRLGPPRVIMLAALIFALVGLLQTRASVVTALAVVVGIGLLAPIVFQDLLPDVHSEDTKQHAPVSEYSAWGPVFRVDVVKPPGTDGSKLLLLHDATFGSGIQRFNGDPASVAGEYAKDPRSLPFAVLEDSPAA